MIVRILSSNSTNEFVLKKSHLKTDIKAVQSFLLKGSRTIGYITIPAFYYSSNGSNSSVSEDLAKEIFKLKRQKIDGLMIGLHGNGGGSMEEAIDLISLFIDEGDLFQYKFKEMEPIRVKDPLRGITYDGPLMFLVDNGSASASELVIMVMREQGRALIVGDTTFGKTSAQSIAPLTESHPDSVTSAIKFTTSKWYNLQGNSYHGIGIVPDIHIPSFNYPRSNSELFESVDAVSPPEKSDWIFPTNILQQKSAERVKLSNEIRTQRTLVSKVYALLFGLDYELKLTFDSILEVTESLEAIDTNLKDWNCSIEKMSSSAHDEAIIASMKSELYLMEGYNIFDDWLTYLKR